MEDKKKKVAGLSKTIESLKTHIFNDVIWPNLSDENDGVGLFSYERMEETQDAGEYKQIAKSLGMGVQTFPVSHGSCMKAMGGSHRHGSKSHSSKKKCAVDSSAYFIKDDRTGKEFLIWGDVEPDSVSLEPRNQNVWAFAGQKIAAGKLDTIFIECSYDAGRPKELLFGHLAPEYLAQELVTLAKEVTKNLRKRVNQYSPRPSPLRKRSRETKDVGMQRPAPASWALNHRPLSPSSPPPSDSDTDFPSNDFLPTPQSMCQNSPESDFDMRPGVAPTSGYDPAAVKGFDATALMGVRVVITHVKETFNAGEDTVGNILKSCEYHAREAGLVGVVFIGARAGMDIYI